MEGRLKPQKEPESKPIITQPDRTQEFLDTIGDPAMVMEEMVLFAEEAKDYDPTPHTRLILNRKSSFNSSKTPRPELPPASELAIGLSEYLKKHADPVLKKNEKWRNDSINSPDTKRRLKSGVGVTLL